MRAFKNALKSPVGLTLIAGVALGAVGTAVFLNTQPRAFADPNASPLLAPDEVAVLAQLDAAGTKLVERIAPSVVQINNRMSGGSGVVFREDGYILTNQHVVAGANEVTVRFSDGREVKGSVIADPASDLAIVKVAEKNLTAAKFADSESVRVGQLAIAIGSPFGLEQTVTWGHVSGLGRNTQVPDRSLASGIRPYFDAIQTDAAINPGNSGGPLVNYKGEVIGINTVIASATGTNSGVGFAIAGNTAKTVADQLVKFGKVERAFLGVAPQNLTGYQRQELGLKSGAYVAEVTPDSPAAKAGLKSGDVVIEIAGTPIRGEADLRNMMLVHRPGSTISIKAIRDGKTVTVSAKLAPLPDDHWSRARAATAPRGGGVNPFGDIPDPFGEFFGDPTQPPTNEPPQAVGPARLGVQVRALADDEVNLSPTKSGVYVESVEPGSPAERAGVKRGMVITQLGDTKITSPESLREAVGKYKRGQTAQLTFGQVTRAGTAVTSVTVRF